MSLKRLIQQNRNANGLGYYGSSLYTPCLEPIGSGPLDNKRTQDCTNATETLTRDYKQLALCRTSSLGDSSGPQRKSLKIFREDNETFGFEIQTLRFMHQNNSSLETCTYVCKVKEGSPAHLSGLQTGYILANINGVSTEGLNHKQVVDSIKSAGNLLRLVTVNEALIMKKMELETKLRFLKDQSTQMKDNLNVPCSHFFNSQAWSTYISKVTFELIDLWWVEFFISEKTLHEKLVEFQSLCLREHHFVHDEVNCSSPLDSVGLEDSDLFPDAVGSVSVLANEPRLPSESSCLSRLSSMTLDSEDSFYQACVLEDSMANGSFSRQSSTDDDCFFSRDTDITVVKKTSLRRHRSISITSNGSGSPIWDGGNISNFFGTLPRKSRKGSVRKRLLKFIPGLHQAVAEEESRV